MPITYDYNSPRWSGEFCDCSMPMTFDTYNVCAYNCLYCFAFFQKAHNLSYQNMDVKAVNVDLVKRLFENSLGGHPENLTKKQLAFYNYIRERQVMQWGGMADGFDKFEKIYGISLELLRFFDKIDYPLSISTKGTWWTKDDRYMSLVAKHAHNWHFKISIITADEEKARRIEVGVDSPMERLAAIKRLSDLGCHVTLRLRPYIIGVSDDFERLMAMGKAAGADSVTTEFFCMDQRATDGLKSKFREIGNVAGFDIYDFYKKNSSTSGYLRLNYKYKMPILNRMKATADKLGLRFYVSDAHGKHMCNNCSCCGLPPDWNVNTGNYTQALLIAKSRPDHLVYWSDIKDKALSVFSDYDITQYTGFNLGSNTRMANLKHKGLYRLMHDYWNDPKNTHSPYKYFEAVLYPVGVDGNGDVIYKYNEAKANIK